MKYLKSFEGSEEGSYLGVTPEDIEYLFTDISDSGWKVDIRFLKKLYQLKKSIYYNEDSPLGLIHYIGVSISKPTPVEDRYSRSPWNEVQELNSFIQSDEYKEIIDVVSLRLGELGLYIKSQEKQNKQLNILIYRKIDKNYIE